MKGTEISYKAYAAFAVLCVAWGSTYMAIRIGVQDMPPLLFGGLRFSLAGLVMLGYVLMRGMKMPGSWRDYRTVILVGLMLLFAANGLIVWAEQYIPSGITSLIVCATPLLVAVFDYFTPGGVRIGLRGWLGLLIGFAGIAFLVAPGSGLQNLHPAGVLALILACFLWAGGSVYGSRHSVDASMMSIAALETLTAGIAMSLTGLATGELPDFHVTVRGVEAIAFLMVVGSWMGYSAFVYVLEKMPPSIGLTYSFINPIVAVILGAAVLNETVTAREIGAFAVILTGVIMTHTARFKKGELEPREGTGDSTQEIASAPEVGDLTVDKLTLAPAND